MLTMIDASKNGYIRFQERMHMDYIKLQKLRYRGKL